MHHRRNLGTSLEGTIEFDLHDRDGCGKVTLDSPTLGLTIPNGVWHGVRLSPGAILLSIASTLYKPDEARTEKLCACP